MRMGHNGALGPSVGLQGGVDLVVFDTYRVGTSWRY